MRFIWSAGGDLIKVNQKHSLRVFENRVLRRIFGPKDEEYI
jgi:hypothetical protein